ncbi:carotenoid oxygenase family protein [Brevundimonas vancanneytii]|uniref:Dioxygenase n=1 Tax=Brevundimonas vancanneytii TaxID=1325724 RepID=A0A4P1KIR3_9CAUL|nr:carotenoid oxygenase family protein [Brevundimonas vancanneytii]VTO20307.1 8'-apo-beta-carotenal 15,15'-oxygenase [Brevundimonas vancanneytii]
MTPTRRTLFMGAAALSGALAAARVLAPDRAYALQALAATADWSLATADVEGDIAPRALRLVRGRAPQGLSGSLYRNGPAKFRRPGGSSQHWFDGDGLIRRWRVQDGQASLAARFADTRKRRQEAEVGAMLMPGFGTVGDPRARIGSADDASPANTSVHKVGGKLWALWEAGSPLAMDPETLETEDFVTLRPDLKNMPFLAHPRIEPDGRIWNLGVNGKQAMVWRLAADGALEDAEVIALPRASYIHDFSATARHLVVVLQPWVHVRNVAPMSAGFDWTPEAGTQVLVVDKADLTQRRIYDLPPFGFFHVGDAWDEADGTIRFDLCAHKDMDFAARGAQEVLNGVPLGGEPAELAMVVLSPNGRGRLERTGVVGEFPRSDPRRAGLARRFSLHTTGERADRPLASAVAVTDWSSGRTRSFDFGPGHVTDEMVYVPKPGGTHEADAWLVGPTINLKAGVSELHVLDLMHVEDGPVATWRADVALPAAFHGNWA